MYKQTESAFKMGLMQVAYITPFLLLSPIAGAMVDRYNRKLMMMVSDHRPLQRFLLAGRCGTWGRHGPADSFHLPGRCPGGTDRLFYPAHPQRRNDPAGSRPAGEGRGNPRVKRIGRGRAEKTPEAAPSGSLFNPHPLIRFPSAALRLSAQNLPSFAYSFTIRCLPFASSAAAARRGQ